MSICKLNILNVGEGDLTIKFDKTLQDEVRKAAAIITELIRKGYAIMVQTGQNERGPTFQRVYDFDADTCEYIVFGDAMAPMPPVLPGSAPEKSKGGRPLGRVPASRPTVAVARSAGGYDPDLIDRIRIGWPFRETVLP